MNADLTFNTIVFSKSFDERDGSERRSTARGINTPDLLEIRSQDTVQPGTKIPGRRYQARVSRVVIDAEGNPYNTEMYFIINVPQQAVSGDVTNVVTTFKALVADADFVADVLNNEK
jgi:hypothetical protein